MFPHGFANNFILDIVVEKPSLTSRGLQCFYFVSRECEFKVLKVKIKFRCNCTILMESEIGKENLIVRHNLCTKCNILSIL